MIHKIEMLLRVFRCIYEMIFASLFIAGISSVLCRWRNDSFKFSAAYRLLCAFLYHTGNCAELYSDCRISSADGCWFDVYLRILAKWCGFSRVCDLLSASGVAYLCETRLPAG